MPVVLVVFLGQLFSLAGAKERKDASSRLMQQNRKRRASRRRVCNNKMIVRNQVVAYGTREKPGGGGRGRVSERGQNCRCD